jgi:hypothetical protein
MRIQRAYGAHIEQASSECTRRRSWQLKLRTPRLSHSRIRPSSIIALLTPVLLTCFPPSPHPPSLAIPPPSRHPPFPLTIPAILLSRSAHLPSAVRWRPFLREFLLILTRTHARTHARTCMHVYTYTCDIYLYLYLSIYLSTSI